MDLASVTHHDFSPLVGEPFAIDFDEGPVIAVLTSVKVLGHEPAWTDPEQADPREAFSLLFSAPRGDATTQRLYRVSHETLGTADIFLVPVGRSADGLLWEAVFT